MRIVTWNCRIGGFRWKAEHIAPLRPDVLAVQEVSHRDEVLCFAGEPQPTYCDRVSLPGPNRGVGLYSYTGTTLTRVDPSDVLYGFHLYKAQRGDLQFQVVAVWTSYTQAKETRYMQAHDGLRRYADWIAQRPTVILGDFNNNGSFKSGDWWDLLELAQPLGLVSAYHHHFQQEFGKETLPTHFFRNKEDARFHLDYVFLPEAWAEHITRVEVGTYEDWHALSDHVPVIVDLDLEGRV